MSAKIFKAVLFDLDGTLVDSIPDLAFAIDNSLKDMGLPSAGLERVRDWVGKGAKALVQQALSYAKQQAIEEIAEADCQEIYRLFMLHYQNAANQSVLYPGVLSTLQCLQQQGVRLSLITNKPMQFVPSLLKHLNIEGFFEHVLGGDSLAEAKPHPLPLLHTVEYLQLPKEQCLMVGDSANDIYAAQAAGIQSVCVTYGYNHGASPNQLPATWHIDSFAELIEIVVKQ